MVMAKVAAMGTLVADELKGVLSTIIGFIRQVFAYVWEWTQRIWGQIMDDPWKFAHLSVTASIMFS